MLNKLLAFIRKYDMVQPGETVICAVSGGADSVALLWSLYLLREKLQITLEAAHYNHKLRGEESDRDERFVAALCDRYDIKLHIGRGEVRSGKKGLEAAARNARYAFLNQLPGKIATAHTADDNAETLLMHMLRGTGLRGLGGITPIGENLIRPMLCVIREEVLSFIEEYHLSYVEDSSNGTDQFLRNRLRHHVLPLLRQENPRFAQSVSDMAQYLREDEEELRQKALNAKTKDVPELRALSPAIRNRVLSLLLQEFGVKEPSAEHVELLNEVVFSDKPSATADFPGKIKVGRVYDQLARIEESNSFCAALPIPGSLELPELGLRIIADKSKKQEAFTFVPDGTVCVRSRKSGDKICLSGGTKSLKKLFIDRKIPASERNRIPVICDDDGVVGVYGIGINTKRLAEEKESVNVWFEEI